MRERRYVKFRTDMYEDTKFKIIDMKPERDLIHYIWTRLVTLAGKVNLEGELYMSKNLPYTIETLAIEFNRGADQIKLALDVFIELEMIEFTEDNIYKVKNFAKHQNIKVKENVKPKDNENYVKNREVLVKENLKDEIHEDEGKESEDQISKHEIGKAINNEKGHLKIIYEDINKIDNNMKVNNINNNSQNNNPILLDTKKNKQVNNKKKKEMNIEDVDEAVEDNRIVCFYDNDEGRPLGIGESVTQEWSFK